MALVVIPPCNGPCLHLQEEDVDVHDDDDEYSDQPQTLYIRGLPRPHPRALLYRLQAPHWLNKALPLRTSGSATKRYIFEERWGMGRMRQAGFRGAKVSRRHVAEIVVNNPRGKAYLRDLNSTLGTWLNGRKLYPYQSYELSCGDVFSLGECVTVTENHLLAIETKLNVFIFNVLHTPRGTVVSPSQADLEARNWHVDQHHIPELVEQVARYLDIQSLKNLRLVNKFWGREATRALGKRRPAIITFLGVDTFEFCHSFNDFVKNQRRFNTRFIETFGSRDRLFNPGLQYTIYLCSPVVARFPSLHEETLWLYTSFMRWAGIWISNLTLQVCDYEVFAGHKGFIRAILEQHAETLEELNFVIPFIGWDLQRPTDLDIPNSVILTRVKKATVTLRSPLNFDNQHQNYLAAAVRKFGRDLATIIPNVETLSLKPSTHHLLEDALLHGQLRALSVLNLTYINCPQGRLLEEPPIPLTKLTLHFELWKNWGWDRSLGHLNGLLIRTSGTLQELELGMRGTSDNFPVDPIKFPRMPKLRKLTLSLAHTTARNDDDDEDPRMMELAFKSLLKDEEEVGPFSISTSFPCLEDLTIVQAIKDNTFALTQRPKVDWTRIMEAFFPTTLADELQPKLSGTLTRLVLPEVNNFRLVDYDLTPEDLKTQFPNLKMISDQNDVELYKF